MPQRARSRQSHLKDCRKPSKPRFVGEKICLNQVVLSLPASKAVIKKNAATEYADGLYPAFSASGQDVWLPDYRYDCNGVVVSAVGARCGKAFKASGKWNVVANTHPLALDEEKIDWDYAWRLLNNENWWIKSGSGQPFVKVRESLKRNIYLPPLSVQKKFAANLERVEKQIALTKQSLADLDSLVKSRFIEMFGDPCDPGSSSAKNRIDSFCELRIGPFDSALHKEDYITGGHPLVNPSHIIGGAIRPDENLTIDDGKYESLAAYHLLPGDVVLGRRGEIGRCAVVKTDGLICGTGSMIIRPGQKVRSDYLQRVVSFPSFSHALEANAVGVTTKNLNAKIVGSAEVFLPDLKDQDAFITLVSQIDK